VNLTAAYAAAGYARCVRWRIDALCDVRSQGREQLAQPKP
jgi:hypothetical protein